MTPREWVTYEVQEFVNGRWIPVRTLAGSADDAVRKAKQLDKRSRLPGNVRAVAITHTPRVIG